MSARRITADRSAEVLAAFHAAYDDLYGRHLEDAPVQFVNFRVRVVATGDNLQLGKVAKSSGTTVPDKMRPAYFPDAGRYVDTAIYMHDRLLAGASFAGPAIVQSREFSALIGPGQSCSIDEYGNLHIDF